MRPRSPPSASSQWNTSSARTGTFAQSCDGAAAYGIDAGIRPAWTMAPPRAASQRASAPTAATAAHNADPRAVEELAHGGDRPDPHHARIDAGHGAGDELPERLNAELLRFFLARNHERRRAVVDAARVSGRHRPAVGAKRRLERRQLLAARTVTGLLGA